MKIAGKKNNKQIERLKEIEEESRSIKRVFQLEEDVRKTLYQLNSQLVQLNELNAIHNRGAVDIADYCFHCLYSQKKFNEEYKQAREKERERFFKEHPEFLKQNEQAKSEQED